MNFIKNFLDSKKRLICNFLPHKPAIKRGLEFADGTFGQPYVYCERCGECEAVMIYEGYAEKIIQLKLDYKFYMMHWDNMR